LFKKLFIFTLFLLNTIFSTSLITSNDIEKEYFIKTKINNIVNIEYFIKENFEELLLKTGGYGMFTGTQNIPFSSTCISGNNIIGKSNFELSCSLRLNTDYYKSLTTNDGLNHINGNLYNNKLYTINNDLILNNFFLNQINQDKAFKLKEGELFLYNYYKEKNQISIKYSPKENKLFIYNTLCKNCNYMDNETISKWKNNNHRGLEDTTITNSGSVITFNLNYLILPTRDNMYLCLSKNPDSIPIFNIKLDETKILINSKTEIMYSISSSFLNKTLKPSKNNFSICSSTLNGSVINITGKELSSKQHYNLSYKTYGKQLLSINRELTDDGLLPYTNSTSNVYAKNNNNQIIYDSSNQPLFAGNHISIEPQINYQSKSGENTNIYKYQSLLLNNIPIYSNENIHSSIKRFPLYNSYDTSLLTNQNIVSGLIDEVIQVPYLFTIFSDTNPNITTTDYNTFKKSFFNSNFIISPQTIVSLGRCKHTKINLQYSKPCNIDEDCTNNNDVCLGSGQIAMVRKYLVSDTNNIKTVSPIYTSNLSVPCLNSPNFGFLGGNIGVMNNSICEINAPSISSLNYCTYNSTFPNIIKDLEEDLQFTFIKYRFDSENYTENYNKRDLLFDFIDEKHNMNSNITNGSDLSTQQFGFQNINKLKGLIDTFDFDLDTPFSNYFNSVNPNVIDNINWVNTKRGEISFQRDSYNSNGLIISHVFLVKDTDNDNLLGDVVAVFFNETNNTFLYYDSNKNLKTYTNLSNLVIGELFFSKSTGDIYAKQVNNTFNICSTSKEICNTNIDCSNNENCIPNTKKIHLQFIKNYYGIPLNDSSSIDNCLNNGGIISSNKITNQILPLQISNTTILNNFHGLLKEKD